jgi:hypothetical protein
LQRLADGASVKNFPFEGPHSPFIGAVSSAFSTTGVGAGAGDSPPPQPDKTEAANIYHNPAINIFFMLIYYR